MKRTFIAVERASQGLLVVAMLAYVSLYGYFVVERHAHFNSHLYDLGLQDQVVWNTAHGRLYRSSVEVYNYLGDHFQPLLALLSIFYWISPSVYWLLLFQTVVLALGAIPVYRLAARHLGSGTAGLVYAIAYLAHPAIGNVNRFDFHWEATVIPLFLMAVDAFDAGELKRSSMWLVLATLGKEEMGLTTAAFGLYAVWRKRIRFGATWLFVGIAFSLLALLVLIPAFRGAPSDTLERYKWLGNTPGEMIGTLLTRPGYVLRNIAWKDVGSYFFYLLAPVAFLPLWSPQSWITIVPSAAYNLLSAAAPQRSIFYQYIAPTIPFVLVAAIRGAEGMIAMAGKILKRDITPLLLGGLLVVSLIGASRTSPLVIQENWGRLENEATVYEALRYVPREASVITTDPYAPHLSHRRQINQLASPDRICEAEVLFLNLQDYRPKLSLDSETFAYSDAQYEQALEHAKACGFATAFAADGIVVLTKAQ